MGCLVCFFLPTLVASIFLAVLVRATGEVVGDGCADTRCSPDGPDIRFPFRNEGQPLRCGYAGFKLACVGNDTVLQLPSAGDVIVTSIYYYEQMLTIYDPKKCFIDLLHFDPSPFYGIDGERQNYTVLNCHGVTDSRLLKVPSNCLSKGNNSNYDVYIVESSELNFPQSCTILDIISLQNDPYRDYYPFRSEMFPLASEIRLGWHLPGCDACLRCGYEGSNTTRCFDPPVPSQLDGYDTGGYDTKPGSSKKAVIVGVSVGVVLLILVAIILWGCYYLMKREKNKEFLENQVNVERFLEDYKSLNPRRYSYADIKKITNQLSHKIGEGAYGSVFKGFLPGGLPVAVKILKTTAADGGDFVNEVGTIGRIHHLNIVRLLGFCADGFRQALIYEFMPNESLAKSIFGGNCQGASLSWEKLQSISVGIARGLEYLHQDCDKRILHFDIKPHNILLDENFVPKISDFGMAKLCSKEQSAVSVTAARGTIGYIAPEVLSRNFGYVSHKSDVYSFGMLLLEMVGGRKNTDETVQNTSQIYFPEWIYSRLLQGEGLGLRMVAEGDDAIAKKLSTVALWCIQWHPVDRPSMKSVVKMLEGSIESSVMPPDPFASVSTTAPNTVLDLAAGPEERIVTVLNSHTISMD